MGDERVYLLSCKHGKKKVGSRTLKKGAEESDESEELSKMDDAPDILPSAPPAESWEEEEADRSNRCTGDGHQDAVPFKTYDDPFRTISVEEVEELFTDANGDRLGDAFYHHISNPVGGQVYAFCTKSLKSGTWLGHCGVDGIMWSNRGTAIIPQKTFTRSTFHYRKHKDEPDEDFSKYGYFNSHLQKVIIHYRGDESVVQPRPHGNAKKKICKFIQEILL